MMWGLISKWHCQCPHTNYIDYDIACDVRPRNRPALAETKRTTKTIVLENHPQTVPHTGTRSQCILYDFVAREWQMHAIVSNPLLQRVHIQIYSMCDVCCVQTCFEYLAFVLHNIIVDLFEPRRQTHTDNDHKQIHVRPHEGRYEIQYFADKRFPRCIRCVRKYRGQLS